MPDEVEVAPIAAAEYEELLPLIEASADVARERGAAHLEWSTAPDNHTAQRLYDSTGAERSEWIEYELGL